jgi:exodeoxyribonuclease-5
MQIVDHLLKNFSFQPTQGQQKFFLKFQDFFLEDGYTQNTMLLRGYAGTGKTTCVSTVVTTVKHFGYKTVLIAPTGRAAKVMTNYASKTAHTIHRTIYKQQTNANGNVYFAPLVNKEKTTLYIVDEASMISSDRDIGQNGLLADLIQFVFADKSNKLMIVGDGAQLPPVGQEISAALEKNALTSYGLNVFDIELKDVVRQQKLSGILYNATLMRSLLEKKSTAITFHTSGFPDIYPIPLDKLEDGLRYAYKKYGEEDTIIICRSNKSAVAFNNYIRRQIRFVDAEIDAGDMLMVVKNNYNTLPSDSVAGFIANGDMIEVRRLRRTEEVYGFRFATVEFALLDYPELPNVEAKIFLDTLQSDAPALTSTQLKDLYEAVSEDYNHIASKTERSKAIRKDPYLNALQVKFAYALTCHKAQGGQWKAVFVDQGFLTEEMLNMDYVRWLYTALTRASNELYLMNFDERFFVAQNM